MTVFPKTLGGMKARIANEIRRTNLADDIAAAISDAITTYQIERFYFAEAINDFTTIAGQEFYSSSDNVSIGLLNKIDYVKLFIGSLPYTLLSETPARMEFLSAKGTNQGQPLYHCFYSQRIRLWPVPNAVFTVRIGGEYVPAAPATDDEANNPWMTGLAERLIRSRAKYELALHRIKDNALAETMTSACDDAKESLVRLTNKKSQSGDWEVQPTTF